MKDLEVLPLDSPDATPNVAGGKGFNLSRLARAGFPVPSGFIVTIAAYRAFVEAKGLEGRIAELSRPVPATDQTSFEDASRAIRRLFDQHAMPNLVARVIRRGYRDLCRGCPVAVRSSATSEDLPGASFAGQHESYLNVRGEKGLFAAVKRCWANLWSARAMAYRARQGIDPAKVSLAVVVQQMVAADAASILFTSDPLTGDRNQVVINAGWGLGETIVGGRVTPDTIVVDKATGQVKHEEIGDKALMTVTADGGTAEVSVDPPQRRKPALTAKQKQELNRLGRKIEDHFGGPQDIEWAIADGRVYILQSRPVMALPGAPSVPLVGEPAPPGDDDWPALGEHPPQPFDLWTQVNMGEAWPNPVTPLTWSGIPFALNSAMRASLPGLNTPHLSKIQWAKRFYGRIYFNEGALAHVLSQEYGLPGSFLDAGFGSRGRAYRGRDVGYRPFRLLRRLPVLLREGKGHRGAARGLVALFPRINSWVAEFSGRELEALSDGELWSELGRVWVDRCIRVLNLHGQVNSSAMRTFALMERLLARWSGCGNLAHDLVTGLSGVFAAEMGITLWQMAQKLRDLGLAHIVLDNSPEVGLAQLRETIAARPVVEMLETFLQHHGHRCPCEAEWLHPRWAEAPEKVVEVMAGYLRAGDRVNPVESEARQLRRGEETVARVKASLGPIRQAIFRHILAKAQQAVRLRDNGRHYFMKVAFPVRRIYTVFGQRWTGLGWLRKPDDFFFLTIPEIEGIINAGDPRAAGLNLPTLVAQRRRIYQYWFDVRAPEAIGPDRRSLAGPSTDESLEAVLHGIPASGGQARGTARIIFEPREATGLLPGDILVTRATDPGWTPLFPLVGGLVLEVGGQLSHGAIVAREYGVPAVVNVQGATWRIQDGQTVTVAGTEGCVYLEAA